MDGMKKMIIAISGIIVAVVVFTAIFSATKEDLKKQVSERNSTASSASAKMEQDIAFFVWKCNNNVSADVSGFYIDKSGSRLDYKLTDSFVPLTPQEAFDKTVETTDTLEKTEFIPERDVANLFEVAKSLKPDMEFETETKMTEEGIISVYAVIYNDEKPELLKIFTVGDENEIPVDSNAEIIRSYFLGKIQEGNF